MHTPNIYIHIHTHINTTCMHIWQVPTQGKDHRGIGPPYLIGRAGLDEVLLQDIVEGRVQLFFYVLDQKGTSQGQAVLQVVPEVLVVQGGDLGDTGEERKRTMTTRSLILLVEFLSYAVLTLSGSEIATHKTLCDKNTWFHGCLFKRDLES